MNRENESIKDVFSVFVRAESKCSAGQLSLTEYASIVCDPTKGSDIFIRAAQIVERIRQSPNIDEQRKLKMLLPAVSVGALFGINRQSVLNYTGLMQIDIDHGIMDPESLRNEIGSYSWVLFSSLSVRRGVWFITRIPEPEKQNLYWERVNAWLINKFNLQADPSRKNPKDLRFYSTDPEAIFNPNARPLNQIQNNQVISTKLRRRNPNKYRTYGYISPIDDFKRNSDVVPLIIELGFSISHRKGNKIRFTRPGKTSGTSAEWDESKRVFYIFSDNTQLSNKNPGHGLSAIDLYTQLKQISLIEARKQLRAEGWGRENS